MDGLLIYSQREEDHSKHIDLVFQKFREASIKQKIVECELLKKIIEYLGHLVSSEVISQMEQKKSRQLLIWPCT